MEIVQKPACLVTIYIPATTKSIPTARLLTGSLSAAIEMNSLANRSNMIGHQTCEIACSIVNAIIWGLPSAQGVAVLPV
jgi:hypothetical protein